MVQNNCRLRSSLVSVVFRISGPVGANQLRVDERFNMFVSCRAGCCICLASSFDEDCSGRSRVEYPYRMQLEGYSWLASAGVSSADLGMLRPGVDIKTKSTHQNLCVSNVWLPVDARVLFPLEG